MKFIGQYIQDFISRFRNDVYIENLSTTTETDVLVVDSTGKVSKNTIEDLHHDTSSQASVNNSGSTYIQDVTLDTYGHITALTSAAIPTLNQDTTGTADTVTRAAQTNITSLGTLTALTVDNIGINGSTITASADLALVATGNDITVDTDNFIIESATESAPLLTIKTTHTTVNKQGEIRFVKDAADTQDNEGLGLVSFYGEDEGNNQTLFGQIKCKIAESDEGAEGGKLLIAVATHDGEMVNGLQLIDGNAEDEIDVTIASGAGSVTTVSGDLTVTGDVVMMANLPTSDPSNAGQLWSNSGVITLSAG